MNIVDSIRARFAARQQSAVELYWAALRKVVRTKAAEKHMAEVEQLMLQIGKSPEDLEVDIAHLERELAAELAVKQGLGNVEKIRDFKARYRELHEEVPAAFAKAQALQEEQRNCFATMSGLRDVLAHAANELREARRRLTDVGMPASQIVEPTLTEAAATI